MKAFQLVVPNDKKMNWKCWVNKIFLEYEFIIHRNTEREYGIWGDIIINRKELCRLRSSLMDNNCQTNAFYQL